MGHDEIIRRREELRLSQRELAALVGVSHTTVQNAERGQARRSVARIERVLFQAEREREVGR